MPATRRARSPARGAPGHRTRPRKSHRAPLRDKLVSRQTHDTTIKGHQVRASVHGPQYIVESGNGGKLSHEPAALTKE
ncbi:HVA1 family protein [Sphingomonas sp. CJ20]